MSFLSGLIDTWAEGRSIEEIRKSYHFNMYRVEFSGHLLAFTNSLWAGAEVVENGEQNGRRVVTLRLLNQNTPNDVLNAVLPNVQVHSFTEVIPSMNEIFISKVQEMGDGNPDHDTLKPSENGQGS